MAEENTTLLVPNDEYLKAGIHIGTKFKTKHMANFIYKTRPDGISVLNIQQIDERLRLASNLLSQYEPQDIMIACSRENGWKAVRKFAEATGCKHYAGRYPPGILTNPSLKNFVEAKILVVVDAWPDRNAITDAMKVGIPVIAFSDTNNQSNNIDLVIPANNKGKKSLGLAFFLLAKTYHELRGGKPEEFKHKLDDFVEE